MYGSGVPGRLGYASWSGLVALLSFVVLFWSAGRGSFFTAHGSTVGRSFPFNSLDWERDGFSVCQGTLWEKLSNFFLVRKHSAHPKGTRGHNETGPDWGSKDPIHLRSSPVWCFALLLEESSLLVGSCCPSSCEILPKRAHNHKLVELEHLINSKQLPVFLVFSPMDKFYPDQKQDVAGQIKGTETIVKILTNWSCPWALLRLLHSLSVKHPSSWLQRWTPGWLYPLI